jgi:hypothetical protein
MLDENYIKLLELQKENDRLKIILAKSKEDCIYCGLKSVDMNKCASGFPGCARADDLLIEF